MNTAKLKKLVLAAAVTMGAVAACSDSGSIPQVEPPPPPPPTPVVFTEFVKTQFQQTADDTNPREVDDTDFAFNDNDNPNAYDDLLSNP